MPCRGDETGMNTGAMVNGSYMHDICFVAPNAYAALARREDLNHIGGAEVQQVHIARELVRRGVRVSFVCHDHGQADGEMIEGLRVFKMCGRSEGVPVVRFVHPRWTSLCAAMRRADARVYYQRTGGAESGQVAMWCRRKGRSMILAVASDRDCAPRLLRRLNRRERILYRYGLRHADVVVAQTNRQRAMLDERFGIKAHVIRSAAADGACAAGVDDPAVGRRIASRRLLWAGRFSRSKRIDRLLALAAAWPSVQFDVAGGDAEAALRCCAAQGHGEVRPLPRNVQFHGVVARSDMGRLLDQAAALVCTSEFEGFPNTFLEAWSRGVPVISTIDPDGVIEQHGLGAASESLDALIPRVELLWRDTAAWSACSRNARRYFLANHTIQTAGDAYMELLESPVAVPVN